MSGDGPAFVDANILVYAFEKGESERKRRAAALVNELMDSDRLRVSTQVLQELYVTLTGKVRPPRSREEALAVVDAVAEMGMVVVDYGAIRAAVEVSGEARISFWDALIVVAAGRCGASVVFTEDLSHGQETHGVRIVNPFVHH